MFLLPDPIWVPKITTYPHIIADVNIQRWDDRRPKLKIYISEMNLDTYELHTSIIRNNAMHDLTL